MEKKFVMATFTSAKDFVEVKTRFPIKLIRCSNYKTAKQYRKKLQVSDKQGQKTFFHNVKTCLL